MPGTTSSILANLAQLSPDSDKASVIAAIHKAVDDLMSQLTANADAVADPKFVEQTKQTILFWKPAPRPLIQSSSNKRAGA